MKVIGAGFGRTGTLSLKAALEELGFGPCYHMVEVMSHPQHVPIWKAAASGENIDWKTFFKDYQSTVDWPGCSFYKQLMEEYPDAKVLLSVRDPDSWYKSCRDTIYKISHTFPINVARRILSFLPFSAPGAVAHRLVWEQTFDHRFEDKQYALDVFRRHIEDVKRTVPAERLLIFDVKEGWEPLCRFLDVPVPEGKPFPRLNDTAQFQKNIRRAQIMSSITLGVGALGVLALLRWLKRR
jgi:hypothetical protein